MWQKLINVNVILTVLLAVCIPVETQAHHYTVPPEDYTNPTDPNVPQDPCAPADDRTPDDTCPIFGTSSDPTGSGLAPSIGGEPVYLFDGSFYYRHTDLTLPGRIPIVIRRAYDTRSEFKGLMGYGWSMNYHIRLFTRKDGSLLLKRGDNSKTTFQLEADGTYQATKGYETVAADPNGTFTLRKPDGYTYVFDLDGCLESIGDKNGNQLLFRYALNQDNAKAFEPFSGTSPYAMTDAPITLGYDFQLIRIDEAKGNILTGRFLELSYNANGRIIAIKDSIGREVTYEYDPAQTGDLLAYIDAEGNSYTYTYDAKHLMTSFLGLGCSDCSLHTNTYNRKAQVIQQKHGNNVKEFKYLEDRHTEVITQIFNDETGEPLNTRSEHYYFDSSGRTTGFNRLVDDLRDRDPNNQDVVHAYTYDSQGHMTQHTNPMGVTTTYTYDSANGNLLTETIHIPDSNDRVITAYEYDPNVNLYTSKTISSTLETQAYRTEYSYDANGNRLTETTFADSSDPSTAMTIHYTYDAYGNVLTVTDPMGHVTGREYNELGFLIREYDPGEPDRQTLFAYDDRGNILLRTDARGNTTTFEYDSLNRPIRTTDPLGSQTVNTYIGANLVEIERGRTAAQRGRITRYEYDGLNRKTAVRMKDDNGIDVRLFQYTYDSEGQVIAATDGNGNTTANKYDELGRLIGITDPLEHETTFAYDKAGNRARTTDAEDSITRYVYDYANRLTKVTNALNHATRYTYNSLGNVLTVTDARDNTTTHTYDDAGQLLMVLDPMGHTTQYAYDKNGNMTEKVVPNEFGDPTGADPIVYSYDAHHNLSQISYPDGKVVTFAYDLIGNRTAWNDGTLSGSTAHDELNRALNVTTNYPEFSKTVGYAYDRFGSRASMTDGEGKVTVYNYDTFGRMMQISHPSDAVTSYSYDMGGRSIKKTLPNGVYTDYTYDPADHLLSLINKKQDETVISSYAYSYDKVGNRLSMTTHDGAHVYSYDDTYQLVSVDHPEGFAFSDADYTYDPIGNRRTSTEYTNWTYDYSNRLQQYGDIEFAYDDNGNTVGGADPPGVSSYSYNYENRMIVAITPEHTSSYVYTPFGDRVAKTVDDDTTWFLYDNEDIIAEYNDADALIAKYYHGQRIDEPVAMSRDSEMCYYLFDGLGSTSELTNHEGLTLERYMYGVFGDICDAPSTGNVYLYTGREYDYETGFHFYRARYYSATIGCFVSSDPIGFLGGINFYAYVNNNPVNVKDPYGHGLICDSVCFAATLPPVPSVVSPLCDLICPREIEEAIRCILWSQGPVSCIYMCGDFDIVFTEIRPSCGESKARRECEAEKWVFPSDYFWAN